VDYTEAAGPLAVSPGSHLRTKVLPSDGRVHSVDAAQVPLPAEIPFDDPCLKKGDAILMNGFAWHEARPNFGDTDRCGLYMKFHARSSPPACGPTIYPSQVHDFLPPEARHLVPWHRGDGRYAAIRNHPVGGVDEARLLIEDSEGRVLVLGDGGDRWGLPRFSAAEDESAGILDVCNVMGSVLEQAGEQPGLRMGAIGAAGSTAIVWRTPPPRSSAGTAVRPGIAGCRPPSSRRRERRAGSSAESRCGGGCACGRRRRMKKGAR
ncbi:MAG: phytanoyl-CoA dioxygenase family protein, partial [Gemmatimonadetes bacterium]|nr:phytanoyl-CoA dioxygenase family protein [Gemmatimonadota bacterium]